MLRSLAVLLLRYQVIPRSVWKASLQRKRFLVGLPLPESQEPELWGEVRALAKFLNAPVPDHIFGSFEQGFAVTRSCVHTPLGKSHYGTHLILNLPMLVSMSPDDFRITLCHELAHLKHDDLTRKKILYLMKDLIQGQIARWVPRLAKRIEERIERWMLRGKISRETRADRAALCAYPKRTLGKEMIRYLLFSLAVEKIRDDLEKDDPIPYASLSEATWRLLERIKEQNSPEFINDLRQQSSLQLRLYGLGVDPTDITLYEDALREIHQDRAAITLLCDPAGVIHELDMIQLQVTRTRRAQEQTQMPEDAPAHAPAPASLSENRGVHPN